MQFISLVALTISAIAGQAIASNVAFNVAPLGTREFDFFGGHAYIMTDFDHITSQRAAMAPPSAAIFPPASLARATSTRSKLPSSSRRPSGIAMSACTPAMTSKEASSRGSTRTRRAPASSPRLRSTRATEFSAKCVCGR
ncbi:hypothetical protein HYPSUDRAFT_1054071 [Hypholoma sublateritium FD-334 SS-4]|uniref:Glycoside hydrolase family 43 protein n=1 Tax=Hypholoma sublateritium (strain FD-334 SS-4) TaxID=945553 RepID=A0A0D2KQJ6_HYPSF|nr:hypothetical protein HYPSUDRAFT_1054071 [Hypholoma sublateritium FD-334 SS-4]